MTVAVGDDVTLHADVWGPQSDPWPVLCLPGLTRNARDFTALCHALNRAFSGRKRIIALESRGRGRSSWAPAETYTPAQEVADVLAALSHWQAAKAHIVGTSRGGLLAMGLAMAAPDRVGRVVLNDIGPIIDDDGLARIGESVGKVMTYPSIEALADALAQGLGAQFPSLSESDWVRFARQVASPVEGGPSVTLDYDPNLATTFNQAPTGELPDLWPAFDALADGNRNVLVVRGANSDLLSAATMEAMVRREGVSSLSVPDEGHAPLLWDRRTQDAIADFLRSD